MTHRFCERCERETMDGNLWCMDPECPAEKGYSLLEYGDMLGDLKITRFVRVWRTAAVYEAERGGKPVLLKLAHPGDQHAERLRRESSVLQSISPQRSRVRSIVNSFRPQNRPLYPIPLSPYPHRSKRSYGEITFRGEPRTYAVFQHARGKILSDLLLETPQVWHTHAAWLIITLAQAVRPLARNNKCHLYLTPDVIMVDTDDEGIYRPMLLDMGFILDVDEPAASFDLLTMLEPAYTAPELLENSADGTHSLQADVYSLGMVFYEMLAGHPGFDSKLYRDQKTRSRVLNIRKPLSVGRPELEQSGVAAILETAVAPTGRYANVTEFANAISKIYSSPPPERKKVPTRLYVIGTILGVILLAAGTIAALTLLRVLSGG